MSGVRAFSTLTTLLVIWSSLPLSQLPLVRSSSVDTFKVQHSVADFSKVDERSPPDGHVGGDVQESLRIRKRYHMPVRSRSVVPVKFGRFRGRKMLFGTRGCASQDLTLTQGSVSSTSGIPTFSVQIINLCGNCAMGEIHVACGNWASATPVDPYIFSRLSYNDCLVNNGKPLSSQGSISFQYSNSAMYPMSITSANNECTP